MPKNRPAVAFHVTTVTVVLGVALSSITLLVLWMWKTVLPVSDVGEILDLCLVTAWVGLPFVLLWTAAHVVRTTTVGSTIVLLTSILVGLPGPWLYYTEYLILQTTGGMTFQVVPAVQLAGGLIGFGVAVFVKRRWNRQSTPGRITAR